MAHKIVPVFPTLDMVGAARDCADCLGDIYNAMLAAAPAYVVTDEDVERAVNAYLADKTSYKTAMRAALEAFIAGLEAKP